MPFSNSLRHSCPLRAEVRSSSPSRQCTGGWTSSCVIPSASSILSPGHFARSCSSCPMVKPLWREAFLWTRRWRHAICRSTLLLRRGLCATMSRYTEVLWRSHSLRSSWILWHQPGPGTTSTWIKREGRKSRKHRVRRETLQRTTWRNWRREREPS